MEHSAIQLDDLPDEILLMIFQKLSNVTLLYSVIGANKRLNQLVHDSVFTNRLTLVRFISNYSTSSSLFSRDLVYPLIDSMLDRFCFQILPGIHQKIQWLCLEPLSMGRILHAIDYPNLRGLALFNIEPSKAIDLFSNQTIFTCILKNQISSLTIDINTNEDSRSNRNMIGTFFTHILTTFPNLRILNLSPTASWRHHLSFDTLPSTVISSTLLELYVFLATFDECLCLLDGRFNQLRTFDVKIDLVHSSTLTIDNKAKLLTLRSFTLVCYEDIFCSQDTDYYNQLLLPLLHRMSNLEKLDLSFALWKKERFVDGNHFKFNIVNHLSSLVKFTLNICTKVSFDNRMNSATHEDIQRTSEDFPNGKIISAVDHFPQNGYSQCHIYSSPYRLDSYENLTNSFPGGLFQCVRDITLFDEQPFEHAFFLRIAQSFPFLDRLVVVNQKRQKEKQCKERKDLSVIKYPCLRHLDLIGAHKDYHEQFLSDTKTSLPNDLYVAMDYQFARKVTRNFRRNSTRSNCAKIGYVSFHRELLYPGHMKDYFPCAKIL